MRRTRTFRFALTTLALGAVLTSATMAYTTWGRWGTLNVSFYVNPANLDVSPSAAIAALQAGMAAWNTQSGTSFRFGYAGQVGTTTAGSDGRNVILFRNTTNGGMIASTYVWTSSGLIREADIVFWDAGRTFFTGSSGCTSGGAYIEDISAHELGHALGLQHSTVTDATMYGTYSGCSQGMRTLAPDDIAGAKALYANGPGVADTPPTVKILSPANGATLSSSTAIAFSGSATDTTDGNISNRLVWRSNLLGQIGTGPSFSRTMTAGLHTITATVTDSIGYTTALASMLTVTTGTVSGLTNTAPSVTITAPTNGATVTAGSAVTFSGSASDTQQGNLTSLLVWRSNLLGQIGTGGSFTRSLTAGTHSITATVTDSGGLTTQRVTTVHAVAAPVTTPTLTATAVFFSTGARSTRLTWKGLTSTAVDIYRDGAKISTTSNDGTDDDKVPTSAKGTFVYKVCAGGTSTCTNNSSVTY